MVNSATRNRRKQIIMAGMIHFRHWSRRRYAILQSLSRLIKICALNIIYTIILHGFIPVSAQTDTLKPAAPSFDMDPVEVLGQRNSALFPVTGRMVTLIPRAEILAAPVESLQDLLGYLAVADLSQRGPNGVQADISIRGGSFDHTMVLLNGIVISDPQTGHFNLDIPIDPEAIQRIELLNGPGARIYGPGAFTGAVNIVSKPGTENYCRAVATAGDFGYLRLSAIASLETGPARSLLNIGHAASEGYAENTDFSMHHVFYAGQYDKGSLSAEVQAGYQQKAFGANGFYSPRYPDQAESNNVTHAGVNLKTGHHVIWQSTTSWQRKKDHYVLQRNHPGFYQNFHLNQVFGTRLTGQFPIGRTVGLAGFSLRSENILSTGMGADNPRPVKVSREDSLYYSKHYNRSSFSLFYEHSFDLGKLSLTAGTMMNWHSDFPVQPSLYPGLDIRYAFNRAFTAFLSLNRALRYPTFTDMFYTDPSHQGNALLEPDRMVSAECGMHADFPFATASLAFYEWRGKNIIDWLWLNELNKYSPVNLGHMSAAGIEIKAEFFPQKVFGDRSPVNRMAAGYHFLDVSKSIPDTVAKYYNLRHKLTISFRNRIYRNISSAWHLCYQDRQGSYIRFNPAENSYYSVPYRPFLLIDGRITWETRTITVFIESSNLLNHRYADAGSVIQPGRWIKAGIKANMVFKGNKRKFENYGLP